MRRKQAEDRRSVHVFVTLKPVEHEALKRRARQQDESVSTTIRRLMLKDLLDPVRVGEPEQA